MLKHSWLPLAMLLLMFPQLVETLYSPALTDIGQAFAVPPDQAAQTLSLYFLGFAAGVLVWGRLCDHIGRRPAMLAGLGLYSGCVLWACYVEAFALLLVARVGAAFGAAVGSVIVQTMLRDRYQGHGNPPSN